MFLKELSSRKTAAELSLGIARYPFNSLDNLKLIDTLFASSSLRLEDAISPGRILDLGCGDGDLGFYMSSLGHHVDLVDFEETNQNRMQMVRKLSQDLPGSHTVASVDLDRGLHTLEEHYAFTIALGLLYHLKNPFLLMSDLASVSNYAVVSTRILHSAVLPDNLASAYLVSDNELGEDTTNFWLFNSKGLARLATRSGWTILSRHRFGDTTSGDLHQHDAREALLLASKHSVFGPIRITHGLNRVEYGSYRWTQPRFGIQVNTPKSDTLNLRYYLQADHNIKAYTGSSEIPVKLTQGKTESLATISINPGLTHLTLEVEHSIGSTLDERPLGVVLQLDPKRPPLWLSGI